MRWIAPGFDLQRYSSVLVEKPLFYPAPQPNAQVSQQTLDEIASYLQQAMQRELAGRMRIVEQPDQDTLVLRSAISAVSLSPEGIKAYELLPITLVAAAAGTRDLDTEIYVELEAIDARTSQPMARVVRKGHGLQLENDSTQLRLDDIRPALDVWAQEARDFKPWQPARLIQRRHPGAGLGRRPAVTGGAGLCPCCACQPPGLAAKVVSRSSTMARCASLGWRPRWLARSNCTLKPSGCTNSARSWPRATQGAAMCRGR